MDDSRIAQINRQLLDACCAEEVDYSLIESLLRQGAEPMGIVINKYGEHEIPEMIYDEVVNHFFENEETKEDLYTITELFVKYGMDISNPPTPYVGDESDALWMFAFYSNDVVMRTLKLLLDHGIHAKDASRCWGHAFFDLVDIDGYLNNAFSYEVFYDCIRKLMLIASYPNVLDDDEYLQAEIWLDQNDYDLTRFRNWNDFKFEISTPEGESPEMVYHSVVTIIEKSSHVPVWRFGVCLDPNAYPELWLYNRESTCREENRPW